jgi:hypothetical protein
MYADISRLSRSKGCMVGLPIGKEFQGWCFVSSSKSSSSRYALPHHTTVVRRPLLVFLRTNVANAPDNATTKIPAIKYVKSDIAGASCMAEYADREPCAVKNAGEGGRCPAVGLSYQNMPRKMPRTAAPVFLGGVSLPRDKRQVSSQRAVVKTAHDLWPPKVSIVRVGQGVGSKKSLQEYSL